MNKWFYNIGYHTDDCTYCHEDVTVVDTKVISGPVGIKEVSYWDDGDIIVTIAFKSCNVYRYAKGMNNIIKINEEA